MPRGAMPRRPSRTGRQDKVASAPLRAKVKRSAPIRQKGGKPAAPISTGLVARKSRVARSKAATIKGYNPLAPARVNEILKRLDERYPTATCALHHNSAWELLVATIFRRSVRTCASIWSRPSFFRSIRRPRHLLR